MKTQHIGNTLALNFCIVCLGFLVGCSSNNKNKGEYKPITSQELSEKINKINDTRRGGFASFFIGSNNHEVEANLRQDMSMLINAALENNDFESANLILGGYKQVLLKVYSEDAIKEYEEKITSQNIKYLMNLGTDEANERIYAFIPKINETKPVEGGGNLMNGMRSDITKMFKIKILLLIIFLKKL